VEKEAPKVGREKKVEEMEEVYEYRTAASSLNSSKDDIECG
jgi:hypothetical protein